MEGDTTDYRRCRYNVISIHSLRMEGDSFASFSSSSTAYFNPLPPHGGRPDRLDAVAHCAVISIHSLRMEGDLGFVLPFAQPGISIHSLRMEGDNIILHSIPVVAVISIHSLRMEGDPQPLPAHRRQGGHFNPLPPHGGRRNGESYVVNAATFQSTPSAWRETDDGTGKVHG